MDNQLYPILQEASKSQSAYTLPLYDSGDTKQDHRFPVIAFRKDEGEDYKLVNEPAELKLKGGEMVRLAFSNLRGVTLQWADSEQDGVKYLLSEDPSFASEKILDPEFIALASGKLHAIQTAIAIPCRGMIAAADANNPDALEVLGKLIAKHFNDASRTPLSNVIFIHEAGRIVKVIKPNIQTKVSDILHEPENNDIPAGITFELVKIPVFTGDFYYKTFIGADNPATFVEAMYKIILQVLRDNHHDKAFLGIIELQSDNKVLPKSESLDRAIADFIERIQKADTLHTLARRMNRKIEVSFVYGEDFQAGNSYLKKTVKIEP
jgi:hypothetical protein